MVRNSQVQIENDALKVEVLKLQKQLLEERNKRGGQVLRAEWNRAFAEATKGEQLRSGTSTGSAGWKE